MQKSILFLLAIAVSSAFAQTSKTVTLSSAGTLSASISESEAASVTNLTLSGYIDARDFVFMRDNMKVLSVLNMSAAKIKSYIGMSGTYSGTTKIYAANAVPDYAFFNAATNTYKSTLTSVTLPSTTVSIGYLAFYYCWNLSGTFNIPATLTKIGDYALYGCTGISAYSVGTGNVRYAASDGMLLNASKDSLFICPTSKVGVVSIPSTVAWIGPSAFEGCSGLTGNLTLPSGLKKIENYAFYY
ncbi:MAG: leucine-rich repeat domain-containing protein, partial [Chryseobacterium sp.]